MKSILLTNDFHLLAPDVLLPKKWFQSWICRKSLEFISCRGRGS